MDIVISLLDFADKQGIDVDWFPMKRAESLSVPFDADTFGIAIDPNKVNSYPDLVYKLGHEIGHCMTGSFYNQYSNFDCRHRHENRADKWAILQLIPSCELINAVADGYTEVWELADYFHVPEQFVKKAICYYTQGNLATELYF